jgi:hypothetical protein
MIMDLHVGDLYMSMCFEVYTRKPGALDWYVAHILQ